MDVLPLNAVHVDLVDTSNADALAKLVHEQPVLAYNFEGRRYDCGSKIGYLQATVELGLQHPEVGPEFRAFLKTIKLG